MSTTRRCSAGSSGPTRLSEGGSVEQHVLTCARCRARVNTAALAVDLPVIDRPAVWDRTRDAIEVPRPSFFERLLARRRGSRPDEARLVAVASAFRGVVADRRGRGPGVRRARGGDRATRGGLGSSWPWRPLAPCLVGRSQLRPAVGPGPRTGIGHALPAAAPGPAAHGRGPRPRAAGRRCCSGWSCRAGAVRLAAAGGRLHRGGARRIHLDQPAARGQSVSAAWLLAVWLLRPRGRLRRPPCCRPGSRSAFLALTAASFVVFLVRGRHLRQLRPRR